MKKNIPVSVTKGISSLRGKCRFWDGQWNRRNRLPVYAARVGYLRRLSQIGRDFGFDQGMCIDRYYIKQFLSNHASDIRGHVLEIGDDTYTRRFGGNHVTESDVLNKVEGNPNSTIVADLTRADHIPQDAFDCIILTQTLQYIYDLRAAIQTVYRILKPGGVLLATLPGIAHISRYDLERWGEYWRLTTMSARRLLEESFPPEDVEVQSYGNMVTAIAFLCGLPSEGFKKVELDDHNPDFQLLIVVRAMKPQAHAAQ